MRKLGVCVTCVMAFAGAAAAIQGPSGSQAAPSIAAEVNGYFTTIAGNIVKSAAMVPEEMYSWQPTPEVRSFARLFGHIADDNNGACWSLAGQAERPPMIDAPNSVESGANKLKKAELEKRLNDSVALCQSAFAAITPANMLEPAGGRGDRTKIGNLIYNTSHINEHYGNLVTYLRLKGMVPPSSAPRGGGPSPGQLP